MGLYISKENIGEKLNLSKPENLKNKYLNSIKLCGLVTRQFRIIIIIFVYLL